MPLELRVKIPLLEVNFKRQKGGISNYKKLVKVIELLVKKNKLLNLNEIEPKHIKPGEFIYFNGTGIFELHETNPETVCVKGIVNECDFFCNCSKKWFLALSSSLFQTLLDACELIHDQNLNLFFLGKIIGKDSGSKELLLLDALYIGGITEDIHELFKNQD